MINITVQRHFLLSRPLNKRLASRTSIWPLYYMLMGGGRCREREGEVVNHVTALVWL
jgi:hypothetical protein